MLLSSSETINLLWNLSLCKEDARKIQDCIFSPLPLDLSLLSVSSRWTDHLWSYSRAILITIFLKGSPELQVDHLWNAISILTSWDEISSYTQSTSLRAWYRASSWQTFILFLSGPLTVGLDESKERENTTDHWCWPPSDLFSIFSSEITGKASLPWSVHFLLGSVKPSWCQ